jgi:Sigma-70 region 2
MLQARTIPAAVITLPLTVGWPQLTEHRDFLVRFAQRRLQDPALAEDLVHDVFEAVVTGVRRCAVGWPPSSSTRSST